MTELIVLVCWLLRSVAELVGWTLIGSALLGHVQKRREGNRPVHGNTKFGAEQRAIFHASCLKELRGIIEVNRLHELITPHGVDIYQFDKSK